MENDKTIVTYNQWQFQPYQENSTKHISKEYLEEKIHSKKFPTSTLI